MIKRVQLFSKFLKKYLPIITLLDILAALYFGISHHTFAEGLSPLILPAIFLMLLPMMMTIVIEDLKLVVQDKKIITIAILVNFVLSPLIGFAWAKLFFNTLDPTFIAGWILKLTVPCSSMMVAWTGMSRGRTETALVIQVVSFMLGVVAIPLWMMLLAGTYIPVNFIFFAQKIFLIVVLPMGMGIGIREILIHKKYGKKFFKEEVKPFLPPVSSVGMFLVIFIAVAGEADAIVSNLHLVWILFVSVLIVYPLLLMVSLFVSKQAGISYQDGIAIGFASAAKNHGIALALAISSIGGLSILPSTIVPVFQVSLMMTIWKMSPKIEQWFKK